jgi:hypothetical protein
MLTTTASQNLANGNVLMKSPLGRRGEGRAAPRAAEQSSSTHGDSHHITSPRVLKKSVEKK